MSKAATGIRAAKKVSAEALAKVAKARAVVRARLPYFSGTLLQLRPFWVERGSYNTVGVTEDWLLILDEEPILRWGDEDNATGLAHESLHVILRHSERRGDRDPVLWNIAGDAVIAEILRAAGFRLLPEDITCEKLGVPKDWTAERIYDELVKRAKQRQGGQNQQGKGQGQGQGKGGGSGNEPGHEHEHGGDGSGRPGRGRCGSGAGHAHDFEEEVRKAAAEAGVSGLSKGARDRARKAAAEAAAKAREAGKARGFGGRELDAWVDDELAPPKVDWRKLLAAAVRRAIAFRPGAVDFRYDRPSRRQGAVGYGAGRPLLPAVRRPVPRVAIALDTSGSMNRRNLADGLAEIDGILRAVEGEIAFYAFDGEVGEPVMAASLRDLRDAVKGGGGTDIAEAVRAAERLRPAPEVLVVVTDGWGDAPPRPPRGVGRVVWVVVGEDGREPTFPGARFGEVVRVEEIGGRVEPGARAA